MTPNLKPATYRIDQELIDGLEEVKRRDGVGISEQIRRAIRAWLDEKNVGAKKETARRRASTRRKA